MGEFFEFGLEALERAAVGVHVERSGPGLLSGDTIAVGGKEAANEFGSLPGVEASFEEFFTQTGEIGFGELFDLGLLCVLHLAPSPKLDDPLSVDVRLRPTLNV